MRGRCVLGYYPNITFLRIGSNRDPLFLVLVEIIAMNLGRFCDTKQGNVGTGGEGGRFVIPRDVKLTIMLLI